jgi:hypothetical protein
LLPLAWQCVLMLITDVAQASLFCLLLGRFSLGVEPVDPDVMKRPPRASSDRIITKYG